jgi:putative transposase
MDGKDRRRDNIMVERLRRRLKYECIYLHAFEGGHEARCGIGLQILSYFCCRPVSWMGASYVSSSFFQISSVLSSSLRRLYARAV